MYNLAGREMKFNLNLGIKILYYKSKNEKS